MKPCHQCGAASVIELTQVVDSEVRKVPLCAKCAAEAGIQTAAAHTDTPLGSLLAAIGAEAGPVAVVANQVACPGCGATLEDFRQSGRLGCDACYESFAEALRELLRRLHGSTGHTGKAPAARVRAVTPAPPVEAAQVLRDRLRKAIAAEQFELAAELRDRLKGQL